MWEKVKIGANLVVLMLVCLLVIPIGSAVASSDIAIVVDGKTLPQNVEQGFPYIKEGRTMVPLRFISENFGIQVKWYPESQIIALEDHKSGYEYTFVIGDRKFEKNYGGDATFHTMDVPPEINNARTYIPLRAGEEIFGKMSWLGDERIVYIQTNDTAMTAETYKATLKPAPAPKPKNNGNAVSKGMFELGEGEWNQQTADILARENIKIYHNQRYNTKMPYPESWGEPQESDNGDGAILLSKNGYEVRVFGDQIMDFSTAEDLTVSEYMQAYYPSPEYSVEAIEISEKYATTVYSFNSNNDEVQGYVFRLPDHSAMIIRYQGNKDVNYKPVDNQPTAGEHYLLYRILTEKFLEMNF